MAHKKSPSVAILLCTFNGENFLEEQLDSIQNQDYKNWTLFVNDDGSKDRTLSILKAYQKKWGPKYEIGYSGHEYGLVSTFATVALGVNGFDDNVNGHSLVNWWNSHTLSNAYDGFTIFAGSTITMTGTIYLYGYAK
jgi:glycosyltransferase involved in cell wall biosynthesis